MHEGDDYHVVYLQDFDIEPPYPQVACRQVEVSTDVV